MCVCLLTALQVQLGLDLLGLAQGLGELVHLFLDLLLHGLLLLFVHVLKVRQTNDARSEIRLKAVACSRASADESVSKVNQLHFVGTQKRRGGIIFDPGIFLLKEFGPSS